MALISSILIIFSLHTVVYTNQVTFTKHDGKILVQSDPEHYAMYGQVTDKDGVRVIVVDGENHYYQTSKCETEWQEITSVDQKHLYLYRKIREEYSVFKEVSPAISGKPTNSYTWSTTFSEIEKEYSVVRLDDDTLVFSSKYFPGDLAKVIATGDIVIFVHYSGHVVLKTLNCVYNNETKLINGIKKSLIDRSKLLFFIPSGDKVLKKYLEKNPIDENEFVLEQDFIKTHTHREYAAMQKALLGIGSRPLNGYRVSMR